MGDSVAQIDPHLDVLTQAEVLRPGEGPLEQDHRVLGLLSVTDQEWLDFLIELTPFVPVLLEHGNGQTVPRGNEQQRKGTAAKRLLRIIPDPQPGQNVLFGAWRSCVSQSGPFTPAGLRPIPRNLRLQVGDTARLLGPAGGLDTEGLADEPIEAATVRTAVTPMDAFQFALGRTITVVPCNEKSRPRSSVSSSDGSIMPLACRTTPTIAFVFRNPAKCQLQIGQANSGIVVPPDSNT